MLSEATAKVVATPGQVFCSRCWRQRVESCPGFVHISQSASCAAFGERKAQQSQAERQKVGFHYPMLKRKLMKE
jgi:hypothetical protein